MAFCTSCGAELTSAFCSQCGEPSGDVSRRRRNTRRLVKWVLIGSGIVVGLPVLAVIILPLLISQGLPERNPLDAETVTLQTAFHAMMAEQAITRIDRHTTGKAVNEWSVNPTGAGVATLAEYLKQADSMYYYCWTTEGNIYPWSDVSRMAKTPGPCSPPR